MNESVSLIPIRVTDMELGKPLPWPVFDWHGKLMLEAGTVIATQDQLDGLLGNGYIHDSSWDAELTATTVGETTKKNSMIASGGNSEKSDVVIDMADVRWCVGETLYLQQLDNAALRYSVHLIGFVKGKTIFVTAPTLDGKFEFIREGQMFVVRAFSGKKAYAFTAAAVKSVHTPHPYLHLTYPRQVRCTVVRQGVRAQVKLVAAVSLGDPERTAAAILCDLSMGGTSGVIKHTVGKKGEIGRIKFKVTAANHDEFLNLRVILRSVAPSENGDGFKHGFEFIDISIHDRLILSAFVHQTLVETD